MADNEYTGRLIESLTRKAIWTRIKEICRQRLYAAMVSQSPSASRLVAESAK